MKKKRGKSQSPTLTVLLHDREELDNDLGRGSDKDLALALALGVDNAVEGVVLQAKGGELGQSRETEER